MPRQFQGPSGLTPSLRKFLELPQLLKQLCDMAPTLLNPSVAERTAILPFSPIGIKLHLTIIAFIPLI